MAPELPLEIWSQIASYIPDVDLCKLYSVNRHLYEIAMNIKYRELRINYFNNDTVTKLYRARTPSLAKRMRYLNIEFSALHSLMLATRDEPFWKRHLRHMLGPLISSTGGLRTMDPQMLTSKSFHSLYRTLLDVVKRMENVQHLRISIYPRSTLVPCLDYVRQLWLPLSGRISSLSLFVPGEELELISGIFTDLSRIKYLSIHLYFHFGPQEESASINLSKFLNRVAGTLESLSLTLPYASSIAEFYYLFNNLDHFSRLEQLSLDSIFNDTTGPGTADFLNNHREGITSLSLAPHAPKNSGITPLSALQLPALRKLDLSFEYLNATQFPKFWSGTLSFPVLDTLTLTRVLPTHDLSLVGDALRRSGISDQLRHLRLHIWLLHGSIFDALALSFPCLHTLYLNVTFLCRRALPWDMDQFSDEMKDRRYLEWSLYDLTIVDQSQSDCPPVSSYAAMVIVAKSVPSIQSFCGNGFMDIPSNTYKN